MSYTARLLTLEPAAVVVTVRVRPLAVTVMRPVTDTLPSFLPAYAIVCLLIFRYERMSEAGSPVTG